MSNCQAALRRGINLADNLWDLVYEKKKQHRLHTREGSDTRCDLPLVPPWTSDCPVNRSWW